MSAFSGEAVCVTTDEKAREKGESVGSQDFWDFPSFNALSLHCWLNIAESSGEVILPYSTEQIAEFHTRLAEWAAREDSVSEAFICRAYSQERSRVLAAQGFKRRLSTILRCIDQVFALIPPDAGNPSRQNIDDAAIWLQAFVINVYGAIDNLAQLWVWETGTQHKGKPLRPTHVGLAPDNTAIRDSLSAEMQEYLSDKDAWFQYLKNYRHALAHRIPLYIPPKRLDEEAAVEWRRLERESIEALRARNFHLYDDLIGQQSQLGVFEPWMMHAFGPDRDDGTPMRFHPQMICDLATVVEIGERMLQELNTFSTPSSEPRRVT